MINIQFFLFLLFHISGLDAVALETHHFFINFFFHIASEIEREKSKERGPPPFFLLLSSRQLLLLPLISSCCFIKNKTRKVFTLTPLLSPRQQILSPAKPFSQWWERSNMHSIVKTPPPHVLYTYRLAAGASLSFLLYFQFGNKTIDEGCWANKWRTSGHHLANLIKFDIPPGRPGLSLLCVKSAEDTGHTARAQDRLKSNTHTTWPTAIASWSLLYYPLTLNRIYIIDRRRYISSLFIHVEFWLNQDRVSGGWGTPPACPIIPPPPLPPVPPPLIVMYVYV